ncbi:MAG: Na+/H+ antiporter subunit E [Planctomycetota bacterium]
MFLSISLFVSLMAFWLLLSGDMFHGFSHPYLTWAGVVCCALVTRICVKKGIVDREGHPVAMMLRAWLYIPWLCWQIVLSNIDVAWRVWHPSRPIAPRMVTIPHTLKTDLGVVVYANSITLTPGTVTVDTGEGTLLVHAIAEAPIAGLQSADMHNRVAKLEVTG